MMIHTVYRSKCSRQTDVQRTKQSNLLMRLLLGVYNVNRSVIYIYVPRYVGHVVSAIEKSNLDQVLSRKRSRSR